MIKGFEELQKLSKDGFEAALQSFAAATKGAQTIVAEYADFARKSFEQGASAAEKLMGARSLDKAFEVQTEYAKSAYETFVAEATKLGELYVDTAKESYKPIEGYSAKFKPAA